MISSHLKPSGVDLDDPGEFAEPEDFAVREITNADLAEERNEVMLAQREHLDVLDQDELVGILAEDRILHSTLDRVFVTLI